MRVDGRRRVTTPATTSLRMHTCKSNSGHLLSNRAQLSIHIRPSSPSSPRRIALDDQRPVTLEARRSASQGILSPRGEGFPLAGAGLAKGWAGRVPGIRQNSELRIRELSARKPKQ